MDVAVLGVGNRAQDHLGTITKLTGLCRLVGICDVDPARAAEIGARYGVPGFTDLDRMLTEAQPQLISVTPIATTLPLADAMIASAKQHGIKLEVSENVWRWPNERLKRKIIEAG